MSLSCACKCAKRSPIHASSRGKVGVQGRAHGFKLPAESDNHIGLVVAACLNGCFTPIVNRRGL